MDKLKGKEKIIGLIIGLVTAALVTLVPALEPLEAHLTEILMVIVAWILGGAYVEVAEKRSN